MKKEQQLLYKIMRNFEGMQKIEVFDLLHKIEILLLYVKSPLNNTQLKEIITSHSQIENNLNPFGFTILPNGNLCEFEGSNDWIHLYKEVKRGIASWSPITNYYFKTKYAPLEILALTKKNLIQNVDNTAHESEISLFLTIHHISAKNKNTGTLFLLEIE